MLFHSATVSDWTIRCPRSPRRGDAAPTQDRAEVGDSGGREVSDYDIKKVPSTKYVVGGRSFDWEYEAVAYAKELEESERMPMRPLIEKMASHTALRLVQFFGAPMLLFIPIWCASTWTTGPYRWVAIGEQAFTILFYGFHALLCGHYTQAKYDREHPYETHKP
jgi:hypothetical protein